MSMIINTTPVTKTKHIPSQAMYAKLSTNDGANKAIQKLMEQSRIKEAGTYKEHVILMTANLGALERVETSVSS